MALPTFETLKLENNEGICRLTINRPDKLNALNNQVLDELSAAFDHIYGDDTIFGVIVTGSGEKAFAAGADIKELSTLNGKTGVEASQKGQGVFSKIEDCPKPVIAVVNGYALGGGTELALSCHIRIASGNAVFGLPEVSLGLIPGYGGTQRLTNIVGKGIALELILSGRQVKADEAEKFGIANSVTDSVPEALEAAEKLIGKMRRNSPVAISHAIKAVHAADSGPEQGYGAEADLFGKLCETDDFREGVGAFLEKRKPRFSGT